VGFFLEGLVTSVSLALLHYPETFSWTEWRLYPDFLVGWLLLGGIYFLLVGPLRSRFPGSEPVHPVRILSFCVGLAIMLVGLQGPLHELSDYFLFSAHMVQHLLIMVVMPPFMMAGIPAWMMRPAFRLPGLLPAARWLTKPLIAFAVLNVVFGVWHFPFLYELMMRDHTVHKTMHVMIMAAGFIMWWPVGSPVPEIPRIPGPLQMVYLFVLGIPMMVVAALITFAEQPLYAWYVEAPRLFPLGPVEDQRLGGLIMWVPGALVMWLGITAVYFRWSRRELEGERLEVKPPPVDPEGVCASVPGQPSG
jgi:putative membrane protein